MILTVRFIFDRRGIFSQNFITQYDQRRLPTSTQRNKKIYLPDKQNKSNLMDLSEYK